MKLTYEVTNSVVYVYLDGELDEYNAASARSLADEIIDANASKKRFVFNLARVTFMDSTGLGFLIGRYKRIAAYGSTMYLENPNVNTDKILVVSGLYSLIRRI